MELPSKTSETALDETITDKRKSDSLSLDANSPETNGSNANGSNANSPNTSSKVRKPEVRNPIVGDTLISLENIELVYDGDSGEPFLALSELDLNLNEGDFVCAIGPSGCGKTSLLRVLAPSKSLLLKRQRPWRALQPQA